MRAPGRPPRRPEEAGRKDDGRRRRRRGYCHGNAPGRSSCRRAIGDCDDPDLGACSLSSLPDVATSLATLRLQEVAVELARSQRPWRARSTEPRRRSSRGHGGALGVVREVDRAAGGSFACEEPWIGLGRDRPERCESGARTEFEGTMTNGRRFGPAVTAELDRWSRPMTSYGRRELGLDGSPGRLRARGGDTPSGRACSARQAPCSPTAHGGRSSQSGRRAWAVQ